MARSSTAAERQYQSDLRAVDGQIAEQVFGWQWLTSKRQRIVTLKDPDDGTTTQHLMHDRVRRLIDPEQVQTYLDAGWAVWEPAGATAKDYTISYEGVPYYSTNPFDVVELLERFDLLVDSDTVKHHKTRKATGMVLWRITGQGLTTTWWEREVAVCLHVLRLSDKHR